MAFSQKTWVSRQSEYPNRRRLTKSDGTTEIVTVERLEGTVSKEGDAFSDENMNDLEQRVADEFDTLNDSLTNETPRFYSIVGAKTDEYGQVFISSSNVYVTGVSCSTNDTYVDKVWRNTYGIWYALIKTKSTDEILANASVNIGFTMHD